MKLVDLGDKCWICIGTFDPRGVTNFGTMEDFLSEIDINLTQKELEFYGRKFLMPRLTAWYGDKEYNYSGTKNKPCAFPSSVYGIARMLEADYGFLPGVEEKTETFNSVLCNYYRDGNDSIDWHSDNEDGLGPAENNVLIASVTFGSSRKFVLRNKTNRQKLSFDLGDGDVLFMGGQTQKHWQHKIPKTSKKIGPRLNLTFRVMT